MTVTFSQLTDAFAAEISGIDIAAGVNDEDITQVVKLFNEYSVLVFHGQDMTDEQQIRFSHSVDPQCGDP